MEYLSNKVNMSGSPTANPRQPMHKLCFRTLDQLLIHAFQCSGCKQQYCVHMKIYWQHKENCKSKANGICHHYKRLNGLFRYHVRYCNAKSCPVPNCTVTKITSQLSKVAIKEHALQSEQQEQFAGLGLPDKHEEAPMILQDANE